MTIYDQVSAHWERLPGDVPRKAAGTHIGIFVAWCLESGLGSRLHERQHADALAKLGRRWYTGRDYLLEALEGVLAEEHLNDEGDAFATDYVLSGAYLRDYEEHLLEHSPTLYHVRDEWASYDRLKPVLDARLATWRRTRGSESQIPAPPPPPAPEPPQVPASDAIMPSESELPWGLTVSPRKRPSASPPRPPPTPTPRRRRNPPLLKRKFPTRRKGPGGKSGIAIVIFLLASVLGWGWISWQADQRRERHRSTRDRHRVTRDHERRLREMLDRARRSPPRRPSSPRRRTSSPFVRAPETVRQPRWPTLSKTQVDAAAALGVPVQFENSLGMRFVLIPAGGTVMGSPPSERERHEGEIAHNVMISRAFYLQVAEVSNALFRRYRPKHRSESPRGLPSFDLAGQPVSSVGYESAVDFGTWVGQRDKKHLHRLPTEAEWEYACRAGGGLRFWWGDEERDAGLYANVADTTAKTRWPSSTRRTAEMQVNWRWFVTSDGQLGPAPVASFRPNRWGLYDMLGNVHEWCADWAGPYDPVVVEDPEGPALGTHRILRGGAFDTPVWMTRCAYRGGLAPGRTQMNLGFRLVAELPVR